LNDYIDELLVDRRGFPIEVLSGPHRMRAYYGAPIPEEIVVWEEAAAMRSAGSRQIARRMTLSRRHRS
jgi:hypothetical protein